MRHVEIRRARQRHQNGGWVVKEVLRTWHVTYPSLPVDDFAYWPQIQIFSWGSKVSDICQFVLKRREDSPYPRWNISRYLPTTTRGLTKNSKNFQPFLRQVRHHILSDSSDTAIFIIILLTWRIMPHSKPKSSPSFGLRTKNGNVKIVITIERKQEKHHWLKVSNGSDQLKLYSQIWTRPFLRLASFGCARGHTRN